MNRRELRARLIWISEALGDQDYATATAALLDVLDDLGPPAARGQARCRWCPRTDWRGLIERHERIVHADELIDLEERRRAA